MIVIAFDGVMNFMRAFVKEEQAAKAQYDVAPRNFVFANIENRRRQPDDP